MEEIRRSKDNNGEEQHKMLIIAVYVILFFSEEFSVLRPQFSPKPNIHNTELDTSPLLYRLDTFSFGTA